LTAEDHLFALNSAMDQLASVLKPVYMRLVELMKEPEPAGAGQLAMSRGDRRTLVATLKSIDNSLGGAEYDKRIALSNM
jgi:hypothetical protein